MFALAALLLIGLGSSFVGAKLAKVCLCFLKTPLRCAIKKKSLYQQMAKTFLSVKQIEY